MSDAPPAAAPRPLAETDRQVLIALRAALAVYILLAIGSMIFGLFSFGRYGASLAIQLILRNVLSVLPPAAVLLAVSVRTPPAAAALDAAAGLGIASILFRFGFLAFSGVFSSLTQIPDLAFFFLRIAAFSAIEAGIAGMAIHLRSRSGPVRPAALIVATVAFLIWDGLVHAAMQALIALLY
jgi:hypothetical protein